MVHRPRPVPEGFNYIPPSSQAFQSFWERHWRVASLKMWWKYCRWSKTFFPASRNWQQTHPNTFELYWPAWLWSLHPSWENNQRLNFFCQCCSHCWKMIALRSGWTSSANWMRWDTSFGPAWCQWHAVDDFFETSLLASVLILEACYKFSDIRSEEGRRICFFMKGEKCSQASSLEGPWRRGFVAACLSIVRLFSNPHLAANQML